MFCFFLNRVTIVSQPIVGLYISVYVVVLFGCWIMAAETYLQRDSSCMEWLSPTHCCCCQPGTQLQVSGSSLEFFTLPQQSYFILYKELNFVVMLLHCLLTAVHLVFFGKRNFSLLMFIGKLFLPIALLLQTAELPGKMVS